MRNDALSAIRFACVLLLSALAAGIAVPAMAAMPCADDWTARVVSVEGRVEARREGDNQWQAVALDDRYCAGDELRTLANSRTAFQLRNDTVLRLDQNTMIRFAVAERELPLLLRLLKGKAFFMSRFPRPLTIETPFVNAASGGTEYIVEVDEADGTARLTVIEGTMHLTSPGGRLTVTDGESSLTQEGGAPARQPVMAPIQALQWALYYPPVLNIRELRLDAAETTGWQPMVRSSIDAYAQGDIADAFMRIEDVAEDVDDPRLFAYRASLLLSVGRVDEARADLDRALELEPANGLAIALQSIVAVVQNRSDEALRLALDAARAAPDSTSVQIALSYAWQAQFSLPEALVAAQAATRLDPGSALAWARIAELWMAQGYLDEALEAARRAEALNPREVRFQTVLGFAYLTQIRIAQAAETFERAIRLNSADPMPRLGLGLAKIRRGELKEGRAEIEIAAVLDPVNPLIRSYLGKAYYEERRDGIAAIQLDLAKGLGPADPTPYAYDAVRKQTVNRPVAAMRDIEQSIDLNDNRAVYRSRLLLDRDLASRSVSRGRIYQDLGFGQRALAEGWRSANTDPMNYSAHRFLADSYATLPRSEIARQSALLTSQLLQPINNNPVQPSLSDGSLVSVGSDAAGAAFNEYTQLFDRDRVHVLASGVAGGHDTRGDELIVSGVRDRYSFSLGQFHYMTDGFRENADIDQRIYNAFVQASVTPSFSIQAEARLNETENGFLSLHFDPAIFSPTFDKEAITRTYRVGAHYAPAPTSALLVSALYQNHDERLHDDTPAEFSPGLGYSGTGDAIARILEAQYLVTVARSTLIMGGGRYLGRDETGIQVFLVDPPFPLFDTGLIDKVRHDNYYLYSLVPVAERLNLSLGASIDRSHSDISGSRNRYNPKLGVIWEIGSSTSLRMVALRAMNRRIVSNQTIEPTQVAGFQQFFEDPALADSKLYGVGLDHEFSGSVSGGVEITRRDMKAPYTVINEDDETEVRSLLTRFYDARSYVYWALSERFAASAEYFFDGYKTDPVGGVVGRLKTHRVPLGVKYFDPGGFFAGVIASYVNQDGNFSNVVADEFQPVSSSFWIWDSSIGYRLSNRRGVFMIGVENLADKRFRLHEIDLSSGDESNIAWLQPRRFIFGKLTLAFE